MNSIAADPWTVPGLALARQGALSTCAFAGLICLHDLAGLEWAGRGPVMGYGMEAVWQESPWRSAIASHATLLGLLTVFALVQLVRGRTPYRTLLVAAVELCLAAAVWARLREQPGYPRMVNTDKLSEWVMAVPVGFEMYGGLRLQLVVAGLFAVSALALWSIGAIGTRTGL